MTQVYDEPGKARKQCPACQKYIHTRSTVCPACGEELKAGAKAKLAEREAKAKADKTKGGRGLKQCPSCRKYVGVRTEFCGCGNDFNSSGAVVKEQPKTKEYTEAVELMTAIGYSGMRILYVPAGVVPIKLRKLDKESVAKWCEDILNHYLGERYFPAPHCYRYLVRKHEFSDKDRQKAMDGVEAWKKAYLDSYEPMQPECDWESLAELVK